MGLYVRYQRIKRSGGAWFVAKTAEGKVVGLATARRDDAGDSQIDGFAHARFAEAWEALAQAAINACSGQCSSKCYAVVSVEDEEKQSLFESLGFLRTGAGEEFDLDGRRVASIRMDRKASQAVAGEVEAIAPPPASIPTAKPLKPSKAGWSNKLRRRSRPGCACASRGGSRGCCRSHRRGRSGWG